MTYDRIFLTIFSLSLPFIFSVVRFLALQSFNASKNCGQTRMGNDIACPCVCEFERAFLWMYMRLL